MRCYPSRLVEALFVGLLLAAVAVAWIEGRLAWRPHAPADSAVSAPASSPDRDGACLDPGFDVMVGDRRGGAWFTPC